MYLKKKLRLKVGKYKYLDFKTIRLLGKGAFGKVYLVQRRLTKDLYAMKTIELNNDFNK